MEEENLEVAYKALRDRCDLVFAILNASPVENRCTEQLEKFHTLMMKDFLEFTKGESTMTEDAVALLALQQVEKELTDAVWFPMLSTKNIVAVAGGFSSGKSKFINTIIRGGDVKLSTGVNPVTAIPTFVQQGESAGITAYAPDGRQGAIPVDLFNKIDHKFIEDLGFNLKSIMPYTTVTAPFAEKLEELGNLCLIDTPGYDPAKNEETEEDRSTTFAMLGSATAVLWFIDIDNGTLHKKDVAFLNKINGPTEDDQQTPQKKLFVVISKADRKESQVQNVIDRVKEDLEENDIPYEGISAFSANKNKEYLDEDSGRSLFDWLREQNKNLVDTAMKIRLLQERVEGVFQMYHDSIAKDIEKIKEDKKTLGEMRLYMEKSLDAKDQEILRLQQNSIKNYYKDRRSYKSGQSYRSKQEDENEDDEEFDEKRFYKLVNDRSSVDEKNDKEAWRICREMVGCIKGIFNELNPELLKNVQQGKKFCGKCGTKLEGKFKFCPKCGAPTTSPHCSAGLDKDAMSRKQCGKNAKNLEDCSLQELLDLERKTHDAEIQWRIGDCYLHGNGTAKNAAEAMKWYKKSAEQGNADGQWKLGRCYSHGEGTEKDCTEAFKWYKKSAEQGNARGQNNYGNCYYNGFGTKKNYKEAIKWFRKSAEQGNDFGQNNLGNCYYFGEGTKEDYTEAFKWHKKSAEQGNDRAQCILGDHYYFGDGTEKDYTEAIKWYKKSAEQGFDFAQYRLGCCFYYGGDGIEKDSKEAVKWFKKSADQGFEEAKKMLESLT